LPPTVIAEIVRKQCRAGNEVTFSQGKQWHTVL